MSEKTDQQNKLRVGDETQHIPLRFRILRGISGSGDRHALPDGSTGAAGIHSAPIHAA